MNLPHEIDPFIQERTKEFFLTMEEKISQSDLEIPSFSMVHSPINGWISHSLNFVENDQNPTNHSEILAMKSALEFSSGKYLNDCTLFTNLEPCFLCGVSIVKFRIKKVVYFVNAAPGQGISSFPIEMIYQSYFFPELIYIPLILQKDHIRDFFKKIR